MIYKMLKATEGSHYNVQLGKDYTAKGTVEKTCDHVDGRWLCLTCRQFVNNNVTDWETHKRKKPRHGDAHVIAWWCFVCEDGQVPFLAFD